MSDDKEQLILPPPPEPATTTALKVGAIMTVIGAIVGAIATQIPGVKNLFRNKAWKSAIEIGGWTGVGGIIGGYASGKTQEALYPVVVENIELKDRVAQLEPYKNYAEKITAEAAKKELAQQLGTPPAK